MGTILLAQAVVASATSILFLLQGTGPGLSAAFGGGVALANGALLARQVSRANRVLDADPRRDVWSMYAGAIERFALTLAAMNQHECSLSPLASTQQGWRIPQ